MFYTPSESISVEYNMNFDWKFYKPTSNIWPLKEAVDGAIDSNEKFFYDMDYDDTSWKNISVPHTFNDEDSFDDVANDAGEISLYRGITFYRKRFRLCSSDEGKKVIVEFEGIRQAAYVYLNGSMVGYYEAGVAPFGMDLSKYVKFGEDNIIAIAADNTSSRGASEYIKETKPGTEPGSNTGIEFQWNTKDFNPIMGGLTRNVKLYVKNNVYMTLPLYSNLKTKGTYVYASKIDVKAKTAFINVEAEIRNECFVDKDLFLDIVVVNHKGEAVYKFNTPVQKVTSAKDTQEELFTVVSKDAYKAYETNFDNIGESAGGINIGNNADITDTSGDIQASALSIETNSREVTVIKASAKVQDLRLWCPEDPYLYEVYVMLMDKENASGNEGKVIDFIRIKTGFRKVEVNGGIKGGVFINDKYYWLRGYAQRSSNEWPAIGVATDWLKEYDAQLIRESNANFIRWMHIAAQPGDIRACDKYGIVCVQPAGDKEKEAQGRNWDQRLETMRDVIIYFRNSPSILFWEAGNAPISAEHMKQMVELRKILDPSAMRVMGCRSLSDLNAVDAAEYVGTMLGRRVRDGKGYTESGLLIRDKKSIVETEYHRDEAPRRVWDDFTPSDFDYINKFTGSNGNKQPDMDAWDLTSEDLVLADTYAYDEFYTRRMQAGSANPYYSAAAALCWSDSNQHGRQCATENVRCSGRVDPQRIKKQSFYSYRVMHNDRPDIFIAGHWNYPEDPKVYVYKVKDPITQEYTEKIALRDAKNKTVYVVASHCSKVELFVNQVSKGICDKPKNSFLYDFPGIDITEHGYIKAVAYDDKGEPLAEHCIETAGEPAGIRLTPVTGPEGLRADGSDVAYFDVEVIDDKGRTCPLDYERIDFEITGPAKFLGGYNSGVKDLKHDKSYVYAECGTNRVFIRSAREAGTITVTAKRNGLMPSIASIIALPFRVDSTGLAKVVQQVYKVNLPDTAPELIVDSEQNKNSKVVQDAYNADALEEKVIKVFINGKEVDFGNGLYAYKMVGVYGPAFQLLNILRLDYIYDEKTQRLTIGNGDKIVQTSVKDSSMYVNGTQSILNDWPEVIDGVLHMEISAVIPALNINAYWGTDGASYYVNTK